MNLVENKKDCCGCAACYNICPQNAIEMKEDEFGFVYPYINEDKCTECGLCKKQCAYQKNKKVLNLPQKIYAAQINKGEYLRNSASGGIFVALAKQIISEGGVVYGATLLKENNNLNVKHIRIDKIEELYKLQGSKYVQSDVKEIYKYVKKDLENNVKVLFSGTPCQIYALKNYFNKKEYKNLYTIDIICHGVPNNQMFNRYLNFLEKNFNSDIIDFKFRDKSKKWGLYYKIIFNKKNAITELAHKSSFYQFFLEGVIYRESCYYCEYATKMRAGDITLGDFWGINKEHELEIKELNIDIDKGVSCILINSSNGECLINKIKSNCIMIESEFSKVSKHNNQLIKASKYKKNKRIKILNLYKEKKYDAVDKYYKRRYFLKNMIKDIIKR